MQRQHEASSEKRFTEAIVPGSFLSWCGGEYFAQSFCNVLEVVSKVADQRNLAFSISKYSDQMSGWFLYQVQLTYALKLTRD
jgi:hypothetical protein